jgi:spore coat polysaccharide biosynthesis protein SpsF
MKQKYWVCKLNRQVKVIIQSRMSSSRLPGKALLPVCGYPAAVLCAKRAANTGLNVCVATSIDSSDDILFEHLSAGGIPVSRGPLNDVYERFLLATKELPDDATVARLTADNMFPDGEFVQMLVDQMAENNQEYFTTSSPSDGLPYGMSCEVFSVRALRLCARRDITAFDREHVTPAIRRHYGADVLQIREVPDWSSLRCTMDSFNDYQRILSVFKEVSDPIGAGWKNLCTILARKQPDGFRIPYRIKGNNGVIGQLTLGAAQLGIDGYGIVNEKGSLSQNEVTEIIQCAVEHGVTAVDCARAYGHAEQHVGSAIKQIQRDDIIPITKLDPLAELPEGASARTIRDAVDASVFRSCYELDRKKLPVLMLHRWQHRASHGGLIWRRLLELKKDGIIGALGASVSSPAESSEAINDVEIEHLQIPFNLLDKRWHDAGIPQKAAARTDLAVYARSAFLQGVLLHSAERWPKGSGVDAEMLCDVLDQLVFKFNRKNRADLCIAYALGQDWIDSVVLGVDAISQLHDNLELVRAEPLTASECQMVWDSLPEITETLLNPALWNTLNRG